MDKKTYKLTRDTPSDKEGDIFKYSERDGAYISIKLIGTGGLSSYNPVYVENNPNWFKEI